MRRNKKRSIVTDTCKLLDIKVEKLFAKAYIDAFGALDDARVKRGISKYLQSVHNGKEDIPDFLEEYCAKQAIEKSGTKSSPPRFRRAHPCMHAY